MTIFLSLKYFTDFLFIDLLIGYKKDVEMRGMKKPPSTFEIQTKTDVKMKNWSKILSPCEN